MKGKNMRSIFSITSLAVVACLANTTPSFANSDGWQGIFTQANQHGGLWTAKVFEHATGKHIVKKFRKCKRAKAGGAHGWACRDEVLDFQFEDDESDSNTNHDNATWNGRFAHAKNNGSDWTATVIVDGKKRRQNYNHCEQRDDQSGYGWYCK